MKYLLSISPEDYPRRPPLQHCEQPEAQQEVSLQPALGPRRRWPPTRFLEQQVASLWRHLREIVEYPPGRLHVEVASALLRSLLWALWYMIFVIRLMIMICTMQVSSGGNLLLSFDGSTSFTSDNVPSGTAQETVFTGSSHSQDFSLVINAS